MPGRQLNPENYKYGFNGQERDNEIAGVGNINTAEFWEYDTRLGRRWNLDPVEHNVSGYSTFMNNPIIYSDPDGADTMNFTSNTTIVNFKSGLDGNMTSSSTTTNSYERKPGGDDVFFWKKNLTIIDGGKDPVTTETECTQFFPMAKDFNMFSSAGITQSAGLLGLYSVDDPDAVTLSKILGSAPEVAKDLISHDKQYAAHYQSGLVLKAEDQIDRALMVGFAIYDYYPLGINNLRLHQTRGFVLRPNGQTTFGIGVRNIKTNQMIRLERHGFNLSGFSPSKRIYTTHLNFENIKGIENHIYLNRFKYKKYGAGLPK